MCHADWGTFTQGHAVTAAFNALIDALPQPARQGLLARSERVPLPMGLVLAEPGQVLHHAWFPVAGLVGMLAGDTGCVGLELGMIGPEGMLGVQSALGIDLLPCRAVVREPGEAWRLDTATLRQALLESLPLQRDLARYACVQLAQLGQCAVCLHTHHIVPRLARWLLMSQDRLGPHAMHATHEALASLLGVRRVGITVAAGHLQARGLIRYRRGELSVLDQAGLEALSCPCRQLDLATYASLMANRVRQRTDKAAPVA